MTPQSMMANPSTGQAANKLYSSISSAGNSPETSQPSDEQDQILLLVEMIQ